MGESSIFLKQRSQINPRSSDGRKIHRYSGLIKCAECGAHFIAKIRTWGSRKYVEYTSTTAMAKNIAHRTEFTSLSLMSWCSEKFKISRKILLLRARSTMKKILALKQQSETLIMGKVTDKFRGEFYNSMIEKWENKIAELQKKISDCREYDKVCKQWQ